MYKYQLLRRLLACIVVFLLSCSNSFSQCGSETFTEGNFSGPIITEWLQHTGDDRDMLVMQAVTFRDGSGKDWIVSEGARVDGTSIPQFLWVFGSPFVGDYRRASVIHDYFCDTKKEPWQSVHRMFYNAVRTDGVSEMKACLMYTVVRARGPQWKSIESIELDGKPEVFHIEKQPSVSEEQLKQILKWVESKNPTLDEIDAHIEEYEAGKL